MPGMTALKISSRVSQEAMGLRLERRSTSSSLRRARRSRSFRSRNVRLAVETSRERDDVKSENGSSTSSCSSNVCSRNSTEKFMVSMQSHGEKVRSLMEIIGQQRQLFEQFQRWSPIRELQARRLRSLFALAQHFDSKSAPAGAITTKLKASDDCVSRKEPEQQAASR